MRSKSKLTRISIELDSQIRDFALKNNMNLTQASRELAKMNNKFRGKKVREVVF